MSTTVESQIPCISTTTACLSTPAASTSPRIRWENRHRRRYYEAVVQRDLFGGWELWKVWGGLNSARGGQHVLPAADEKSGLAELAQLCRHRERRGYVRVTGGSMTSSCAVAK